MGKIAKIIKSIIIGKILKQERYIKNINIDLISPTPQKRILLSYLDLPFKIDLDKVYHSNIQEVTQLVKAFMDRGMIVDIVSVYERNVGKALGSEYDIIWGFGEPFEQACRKNKNARKILYLTENHPVYVKKQFEARVQYYQARHNKKQVGIERTSAFYTESQFNLANSCVHISNRYNSVHLAEMFDNYYSVSPSALKNESFIFSMKDFTAIKQNYLWFGSSGVIHKGLDILVDVFNTDKKMSLGICGLNKKERKIVKIRNKQIIDYGFVEVTSNKFIEIVDNTAFVILPSCSEGVSTAVATCMLHGLIPIVTRETGLDLPEILYLKSYKVEDVYKKMQEMSNLSNDDLNALRTGVYEYAIINFTLLNFRKQIDNILDEIIQD